MTSAAPQLGTPIDPGPSKHRSSWASIAGFAAKAGIASVFVTGAGTLLTYLQNGSRLKIEEARDRAQLELKHRQQQDEFILKYFDRVIQTEVPLRMSLLRYFDKCGGGDVKCLGPWAKGELRILEELEQKRAELEEEQQNLLKANTEAQRDRVVEAARQYKTTLRSIVPAPPPSQNVATKQCRAGTLRLSLADERKVPWKKCSGPPRGNISDDGVNLEWLEEVSQPKPAGGTSMVRCTCVAE